MLYFCHWAVMLVLMGFSFSASAANTTNPSEARTAQTIRQNVQTRLPQFPKIDEVRPTPMPGLYELRVGKQLLYSDAKGDFLIDGSLLDTRRQINLTQSRTEELGSVAWKALPLQDAVVTTVGNGQRKIAVFEDPNCGYCKVLEKDLRKIGNVTVYAFLYPVLGQDSVAKAQAIWCAKDRPATRMQWMVNQVNPTKNTNANAGCNVQALSRNLAFGREHQIMATPTLFFPNGKRIGGALSKEALAAALDKNAK